MKVKLVRSVQTHNSVVTSLVDNINNVGCILKCLCQTHCSGRHVGDMCDADDICTDQTTCENGVCTCSDSALSCQESYQVSMSNMHGDVVQGKVLYLKSLYLW